MLRARAGRSTRQDRRWAPHSGKRFLITQSFKSCPTKSRKGKGGITWDLGIHGTMQRGLVEAA